MMSRRAKIIWGSMNPSSSLYEFFNINQMAHQIIICKLEAEKHFPRFKFIFFFCYFASSRWMLIVVISPSLPV